MAEKADPHQVVTVEEPLRSMMYEQEATRRVLVRKGLLTSEEVLEEIKAGPYIRSGSGVLMQGVNETAGPDSRPLKPLDK